MPSQSWQQTLTASAVDGPAITNSTTQASIIPTSNKFTLPANYLQIGQQIAMRGQGRLSCVVTTPGTLLFQVLFNAVVVANPTPVTMALNTTAKTNVPFWFDCLMTVRAVGSGTSANLMWQMQTTSEALLGAAATNNAVTMMLPQTAPAVGTGFDSTIAQAIDLQAKFSVATATTAITLHQYRLEVLN